jgi:hypothetical protein
MRVGLLARFLDLFFSLKLLLSGNTPGGLAVGAAQRYQAIEKEQAAQKGGDKGGPWYHGRVVREHGYTALQYYFLYAYNDWRSSFHGVNDHESDWELMTVYAAEDANGHLQPCWMACSAHLGAGDDLRRRWDDPDLERVGEHPLVYVGAGSHANYFFKGEYMPAVEAPFTRPITRAWTEVRRLWARLGQEDSFRAPKEGVNIPFVDYARGDGLRIGPGQSQSWQVCLLQPTVEAPAPVWLESYRGLWGLHRGIQQAAKMRLPVLASNEVVGSGGAGTIPSAGAGLIRPRRQRLHAQFSSRSGSDCRLMGRTLRIP